MCLSIHLKEGKKSKINNKYVFTLHYDILNLLRVIPLQCFICYGSVDTFNMLPASLLTQILRTHSSSLL